MIMKLNENKTIIPPTGYVFIRPLENPYIETVQNGIIVSSKSKFSTEGEGSGRASTAEEVVGFGIVLETGIECKYLERGDEVYYDSRGARPVPFGALETVLVHEQNVLGIIRDKEE